MLKKLLILSALFTLFTLGNVVLGAGQKPVPPKEFTIENQQYSVTGVNALVDFMTSKPSNIPDRFPASAKTTLTYQYCWFNNATNNNMMWQKAQKDTETKSKREDTVRIFTGKESLAGATVYWYKRVYKVPESTKAGPEGESVKIIELETGDVELIKKTDNGGTLSILVDNAYAPKETVRNWLQFMLAEKI